ncbi:MAG: site-specific DNA-methyltransferase [Candidatus Woesearchaeota archaeon]
MGEYNNLSKEELLKIIKKQELDLKSKKYGLVWDDEKEPEQVVLDCRDNLPILKRVKTKEIKEPKDNNKEDNILIEGDNYHALTVLNYTHQEKIDVIYIDPPYNTEKEGFIYNDVRVDINDGYRHSKWLNFMQKRLNLAKELLKKKGVIFISIDKNEFAQLKLLCDSIFDEKNFLGEITRKQSSGSKNDTGNDKLITNVDKILIYSKGEFNFLPINKINNKKYSLKDEVGSYSTRALEMQGGDDTLNLRPKMGYSIYYNHKKNDVKIKFDYSLKNKPIYLTEDKNLIKKGYLCYRPRMRRNKHGIWRWGEETFFSEFNKNNVIFKDERVFQKEREKKELEEYPNSLCLDYINTQGTLEVKEILKETKFSFPKPVGLIKYLLKISTNSDAIILDFFAGSGTTAQAVLELNKEDEGNRKFILCTNNENNICTEITYPRIEKVIKGYDFKGKDKTILFEKKISWTDLSKKTEEIIEEINEIIEENKESYDEIIKEFKNNLIKIIGIKEIDGKKEGLDGNLQYFKTSLLQQTKNRDQTKINLTQKCGEMICLKENIFNLEFEEEDYKIFSSNNKTVFLCIYFNFIDESFNDFFNRIKDLNGKKIIYMFSLEDKSDSSLFKEISNYTLEVIPRKILEVYKKLVKMNIPIKAETIFIDLEKAKKQIFEDKDKDTGAKTLRVVLEKLIQKIAQKNQVNMLTDKGKEILLSTLNDTLKNENIFSKVEWEENKTYLAIGNHASHGEYTEFDLTQSHKFYKHIQTLINKFNI